MKGRQTTICKKCRRSDRFELILRTLNCYCDNIPAPIGQVPSLAKPQPLCPTIHPPPHLALLWGPADEAGRKPASRRSAEDGSRLPAGKWRGLGELCAPGQLPTQKERQGQLSLRQPHHPPRGQIPRLATPPAPGPHLAAAADCLPPRSLDRHTSRHRKDALASLFPQTPKLPPAGCTGDCLTQYLGPWDHATVACLGRPGTGTKSESESEAGAASTGAGEPRRGGGELGPGKPAGEQTPRSQDSSVQSLSHVRLFATPGTAARQASLSITNSRSLSNLIELVMPPQDRDSKK